MPLTRAEEGTYLPTCHHGGQIPDYCRVSWWCGGAPAASGWDCVSAATDNAAVIMGQACRLASSYYGTEAQISDELVLNTGPISRSAPTRQGQPRRIAPTRYSTFLVSLIEFVFCF